MPKRLMPESPLAFHLTSRKARSRIHSQRCSCSCPCAWVLVQTPPTRKLPHSEKDWVVVWALPIGEQELVTKKMTRAAMSFLMLGSNAQG
jgi:hypothetical protein